MGKKTRSVEKAKLNGKHLMQHAQAYRCGTFDEDIWGIAGAFKGCRPLDVGIDIATAKTELIKLVEEAAKNSDSAKLRQLADAMEEQNKSGWHNPLGRYFLKVRDGFLPFSKELAEKTGIQGFPILATEKPKTAQEIQDLIRANYPHGCAPRLKTIREMARELEIELPKAKRGARPGVKRKSLHRAPNRPSARARR